MRLFWYNVLQFIYKNMKINQVVLGITDGLIFVKPNVFEKYFWLSIPVLSFSAAFGLTISKP